MSTIALSASERRRYLVALIAGSFSAGIGFGAMHPLIALLLEQRGVDNTLIGLNAGLISAAILIGVLKEQMHEKDRQLGVKDQRISRGQSDARLADRARPRDERAHQGIAGACLLGFSAAGQGASPVRTRPDTRCMKGASVEQPQPSLRSCRVAGIDRAREIR